MSGQLPSELAYTPDGAWIESYSRRFGHANNGGPTSGRIRAVSVWLRKGWEISAVRFFAGTTAGAGITHSWAGIWHQESGDLLGASSDVVVAAWPINSVREFVFPTPLLVEDTALHWVGRCVAGATVPSALGAIDQATGSRTAIYLDQSPAQVGQTTAAFTGPASAPDPIVLDDPVGVGLMYAVVL